MSRALRTLFVPYPQCTKESILKCIYLFWEKGKKKCICANGKYILSLRTYCTDPNPGLQFCVAMGTDPLRM